MEEYSKKIKNETEKLLKSLGFSADVIISKREEIYFINVEMNDSALLIGRHGEGLEAFQHVLRLLIFDQSQSKSGTVVFDINGYREKRGEMVEGRAKKIAHEVRTTGQSQDLGPMNSYERRLIHLAVANIADVETESRGEGIDRRIIIKPKK